MYVPIWMESVHQQSWPAVYWVVAASARLLADSTVWLVGSTESSRSCWFMADDSVDLYSGMDFDGCGLHVERFMETGESIMGGRYCADAGYRESARAARFDA